MVAAREVVISRIHRAMHNMQVQLNLVLRKDATLLPVPLLGSSLPTTGIPGQDSASMGMGEAPSIHFASLSEEQRELTLQQIYACTIKLDETIMILRDFSTSWHGVADDGL